MTTEKITTTKETFRGYYGTVTFEDGRPVPVYVINERSEMKFLDGTIGAAIKVCYGQRYLVAAGHRYATSYGSTGYWIKAERLTSRKAA
jgi:hypothetical protein